MMMPKMNMRIGTITSAAQNCTLSTSSSTADVTAPSM